MKQNGTELDCLPKKLDEMNKRGNDQMPKK